MINIHPTAVVDREAELGPDVTIGPYAVIEGGVKIGRGTKIGAFTYICRGVTIGEENDIHMHVVIGNAPQDWHWKGDESFVVIGDRNVIRELVTIHRGTQPGSTTRIGNANALMAASHVAHNCVLADGIALANGALLAGHVEVGSRAFISGNALVHQFARIGRLAMIAGGARVSRDVPPFCLMEGESRLRGINRVGIRRAKLPEGAIARIGRAYRRLFLSGEAPDVAARAALAANPDDETREMAEFVLATKRGICLPERRGAPTCAE